MRVMESLTKLVVGMSRFGDHLLSRKVSGIIVAALAFACGAGLARAPKRGPRTSAPSASPAPVVSPARRAEAVPPAPGVVAPTGDDDEEEYGTRELQEWKNLHGGATLPLSYDSVPNWSKLSRAKVVVLPSGRTLAAAGDALYMLGPDRRVLWRYDQPTIDFAYVASTGVVCGTGYDNYMYILDASTGRELVSTFRNGRAGYGAVLKYGEDVCLVMDEFSGYRAGYTGGYEPTQDGVTAWRGTRMLWEAPVPPDAELQVVGSKIYAVTKTKDRILVREVKVPKR